MEIALSSRLNAVVNLLPSEAKQASETASPDEDAAWMLRAREGEEQAFACLVEKYSGIVIGLSAKMLGDHAEAEDMAQQVFVRAWKARQRYEASAKFSTWILRITRNTVLNEIRRRKRHPQQSLDQPNADGLPYDPPSPAASPQEEVQRDEVVRAVDAALLRLPENQCLAMTLLRYEQLPYEEIAKIMNLQIGAVKSLIFRARQQLRSELKKFLELPET
ncbi:MAG: RNA polymerase sigma factor [Chthoniobacterales bacterium]